MTAVPDAIRVLLADDHPVVRNGIRAALEDETGIEVVGEADDAHAAQRMCRELQPDVLLLDLSMPGPSAVDTIAMVHKECPDTRVMVLTAHDHDDAIRTVMRAGVSGYLLKEEAIDAVTKAVRAVHGGAAWYSRRIAERFTQWQFGVSTEVAEAGLTKRERELLALVAKGWDNARIADTMGLAEQTVRNYSSNLYDKLGVHSRPEAVVWALEHGFRTEEP